MKSVVLKLTSGMHKVRFIEKYSCNECQRVRPAPEGEECRPQAHQWYAQGKVHRQLLHDEKVKSVVPKLTSGMHKVRVYVQALLDM